MLLTLLLLLCTRLSFAGVELRLAPVDQQHVRVVLSNQGTEPLRFLTWGSPFESELTQDLFYLQTTFGKQRAAYAGRHVKRAGPLPEHFTELLAQQSLDVIVPLANYYDLPASGEYAISMTWSMQVQRQGRLQPVSLQSAVINTWLYKAQRTIAALPADYNSCEVEQQSELQQALDNAESLTQTALNDLSGLTDDARYNSPRYKQWFGAYDTDRFDLVLDTYSNLAATLANETIEFNCNCERASWYAYVLKSREFEIFICPRFWTAISVGRDSQAGTLIHELTHFFSVNGTSDHAYSTAAVTLANENPQLAVRNADSYEYFAENVPRLAIFNGVVFNWLE
ncbi:MAG: M35 family metallo-endopeptidase, partial [Pseudomonadota bacterium]